MSVEKQKFPFCWLFERPVDPHDVVTPEVDGKHDGDDLRGLQRSGWYFAGEVHQDYYAWFEDFYAYHPEHGYVKGNYSKKIEASSQTAYEQFRVDHPPERWSLLDI